MAAYALSDIHGCIKIYEQVKAFLKPDDIVFFLGDAGDRGPHSWECIKAIYNDPQFIYLKGNHEDMLHYAMQHYFDVEWGAIEWNGGEQTVYDWAAENVEDDVVDPKWVNRMEELPLAAFYVNKNREIIYMTHSGYLHGDIKISLENIGDNFQDYYGLYYSPSGRAQDYVWDRNVLRRDFWHRENNEYIIHGHSPVPLCFDKLQTRSQLETWHPDIHMYADNHMIDIDLGTHYTGWACLLNLDTWDEHYFETDERAK